MQSHTLAMRDRPGAGGLTPLTGHTHRLWDRSLASVVIFK
jgi:hypothetical protein